MLRVSSSRALFLVLNKIVSHFSRLHHHQLALVERGNASNNNINYTMGDYINNASFETINFSRYPPFLVAWPIFLVDTICDHYLGGFCSDWRNVLPEQMSQEGSSSWFSVSHKMENTPNEVLPDLLSYQDFLNTDSEPPYSWASIKGFAFETSSTSLASVLSWPSLIALVVLVSLVRLVKAKSIPRFSNMARIYCRKTHGPMWEKDKANEQRILKFGEYVFRLCFHSAISLVGIFLFYDKPWWSSVLQFLVGGGYNSNSSSSMNEASQVMGTRSLYINFPSQPVEPGMVWYYLVQCAYNAEAMMSLLEISFQVEFQSIRNQSNRKWQLPIRVDWSESCRGDFREMFIHHVFTNLLIIGSSFYRFHYIGSMVFFVHDISDIPVDLSKLANFLKWKTTTTICFVTMCITWLQTRLIILPFIVWRSIIYESWLVCADGYIPPMYYNMFQPVFVFLLGFLILLHFFWFTMFIRMGYVLIRKGEAHDLSEHKNGEARYSSSKRANGAIANGVTNGSANGSSNEHSASKKRN